MPGPEFSSGADQPEFDEESDAGHDQVIQDFATTADTYDQTQGIVPNEETYSSSLEDTIREGYAAGVQTGIEVRAGLPYDFGDEHPSLSQLSAPTPEGLAAVRDLFTREGVEGAETADPAEIAAFIGLIQGANARRPKPEQQ